MKVNVPIKVTTCLLWVLFLFSFGSVQAGLTIFEPKIQENKNIDQLNQKAIDLTNEAKYDQALNSFLQIEKISKKENYDLGLYHAYIGLANVYFLLNKLDLSTQNLNLAKETISAQNNPYYLAKINFREGLILHALGLYTQSIEKFRESNQFSKQIKDNQTKIDMINSNYVNIGDVYQQKNNLDSAIYYYELAKNSQSTQQSIYYTSSLSIADILLDQGKTELAKKHIDEVENLHLDKPSEKTSWLLHSIKGKYYEKIGQLTQAIDQYKLGFEISRNNQRPKIILLKKISYLYRKLGQEQSANQYLIDYVSMSDSVKEVSKNNIKAPVIIAKLESENQIQEAKSKNNQFMIYFAGILVLIIFFVWNYTKRQRNKIQYRKQENQQLKKKLNSAFDEVTDLAKTNSPNFLSRFIEVYPDFYNHLITYYPDLTNADLKLCALMKLDYSTKEISEITYSSLRTVQNRKYKLRKKFNLSSEENLNLWIQNLHIQTLSMVN